VRPCPLPGARRSSGAADAPSSRPTQHLKDLEERVVSLEQRTQDQDAENAALKQLLEKCVPSLSLSA